MPQEQIDQSLADIERFRNENVIPLAKNVLPAVASSKVGVFTKDDIMKQLGILSESYLFNTVASLTDTIVMLINLATLIDELALIAVYDVNSVNSLLENDSIKQQQMIYKYGEKNIAAESKKYQKILKKLLKLTL